MDGLVKIYMVPEKENWAFPDIETFIDFVVEHVKATQKALVRLPQDDPYNLDKFLKQKYHALLVDDDGEIVAEKMQSRKRPNLVIAKGKEEVAQLLREVGW
jgi:hypothetical protein